MQLNNYSLVLSHDKRHFTSWEDGYDMEIVKLGNSISSEGILYKEYKQI